MKLAESSVPGSKLCHGIKLPPLCIAMTKMQAKPTSHFLTPTLTAFPAHASSPGVSSPSQTCWYRLEKTSYISEDSYCVSVSYFLFWYSPFSCRPPSLFQYLSLFLCSVALSPCSRLLYLHVCSPWTLVYWFPLSQLTLDLSCHAAVSISPASFSLCPKSSCLQFVISQYWGFYQCKS